MRALAVTACLVATLAGCAAPRTPYSRADAEAAIPPGLPTVRVWADAPASAFADELGPLRERGFAYLALSGGGGDGAYGAGVLAGWSRTGTRPQFAIVSGVSTGAFIAPFAFLGPRYDGVLRDIYTGGYAASLAGEPNLLGVVFGTSLFGNAQLRKLVARFVDADLLAEIAREHERGRRLLVVTTDLDAQKAVVWNMGAVAASGAPNALEIFRDVLTASASIPVIFAPTLIDATAEGRLFQEMHVDGSVTTPVFAVPQAYLVRGVPPGAARGEIFALMNTHFAPKFGVTPGNGVAIGARALVAIDKSQARANMLNIRDFARRSGIGFNLSYIGEEVPEPANDLDAAYMRRLFAHGYEKAVSGRAWRPDAPPD
jgi:hypothetical protein